MPFEYTISLDLKDSKVLVVGAGTIGTRKARGLIRAGAKVVLVSPKIGTALAKAVESAGGQLRRRRYRSSDLLGVKLVFAATDDDALNAHICRAAKARDLWASSASRASDGGFSVPAQAADGPIRIAISTGGASPALAKALKDHLQKALRESGLAKVARKLQVKRSLQRKRT